MKRYGTVLVFKPEVSPAEAARKLREIADVLDLPAAVFEYLGPDGQPIDFEDTSRPARRVVSTRERQVDADEACRALLHSYDDEDGTGPVWYLP